MCTRFVYRGDNIVTGFHFDIDLDVWNHRIIKEEDRFYIGILRSDGLRYSYHGVNRNGNVGTLLYVHGNPAGAFEEADASMQAVLSDCRGRTLIIEPGLGSREDTGRYSLMTNYSLLAPESTRPFIVPGDDRYERAERLLKEYGDCFTVEDAFSVLQSVRQEGRWATRVSFVYSLKEQTVYYVENNHFEEVKKYRFFRPCEKGEIRI